MIKNEENQTEECETGDDDKCLECDLTKNQCSKCNLGYKLINGKCIINYSFKATYFSKSDKEIISLINPIYVDDIIEININNKTIPISDKYIFTKSGNHTLYFSMNIPSSNSLSLMFHLIDKLISISFTSQFNTENVTDIS